MIIMRMNLQLKVLYSTYLCVTLFVYVYREYQVIVNDFRCTVHYNLDKVYQVQYKTKYFKTQVINVYHNKEYFQVSFVSSLNSFSLERLTVFSI